MAYSIRLFREIDAGALAALTNAAIHTTGALAYTPHQVVAWAARHPGPGRFVASAAKGDTILVAADAQDCPCAYALIEPDGHVDMLYCHPDHGRRGLGGQLLDKAENRARAAGMTRLFTEASELARPTFRRAGFRLLRQRNFMIPHTGAEVAMHNYAMEKILD